MRVVLVVVLVAACQPAPPEDEPTPERALISLFDLDDDGAVCAAGAPGFDGFASRNCAVDVDFGSEQTFIVENNGDAILVIERVTFVDDDNPSGFHLVRAPASVGVGELAEVIIGNDGGTSSVLRIESDAENDPVVEVALNGTRCVGDIDVQPAACDFGNVVVGDTEFCDIGISNHGECEVIVADLAFSDDTPFPAVFGPEGTFSLPVAVSGGVTVSLRIYARPQDATTSTGALLISSFDPDEPTVSVPLRVTGL